MSVPALATQPIPQLCPLHSMASLVGLKNPIRLWLTFCAHKWRPNARAAKWVASNWVTNTPRTTQHHLHHHRHITRPTSHLSQTVPICFKMHHPGAQSARNSYPSQSWFPIPYVQCLLSTVFQFACRRKLLSVRDPFLEEQFSSSSSVPFHFHPDSSRWSVKRFVLWLRSICRLPSLSRTAPFYLLVVVFASRNLVPGRFK